MDVVHPCKSSGLWKEGREAGEGREDAQQMAVVLITGCSNGGIGYALALAFARKGCRVIASTRSLASMDGLHKEAAGIELLEMDVSSHDSIIHGVQGILQKHGRIDVLVNNAGIHCIGPVAEVPLSRLEHAFRTNVYGAISLIQAVVPQMITRRQGKIVNIGSVTAFAAGPWAGGYAATKAALHALSDSLRVELKPFGVDVIVIAPSAIRSKIGSNATLICDDIQSWKFYKPWETAIRARASASQLPQSTPTDEFAEQTVNAVLKKRIPACLILGRFSGFYTAMYYLPLCIRDWIMKKYFGVHDLSQSKKSD